MFHKTKGIVIQSVKYSDKAWIITVYTEQFGRESYMVYGVNRKKSAFRAAYLQPFTMIEMNVSHTPGREIHQIKDVQVTVPLTAISAHPVKNAIALFLSEFLFKILRISESDSQMYDFMENSIQILEHSGSGIANFHLLFLVRLTRYLGFEPGKDYPENSVFDLVNGIFTTMRPIHSYYIPADESRYLHLLLNTSFADLTLLAADRNMRAKMIDHLITYYKLHVPGFAGVQSVEVLHALFD